MAMSLAAKKKSLRSTVLIKNAESADVSKSLLDTMYEEYYKPKSNQVITCSSRLAWLWFVAFIFMLAYQCSLFTLEQHLYKKLQEQTFTNASFNISKSLCETNTSSDAYRLQLEVQDQTARWSTYYYIAGGIPSIISNFVLGAFTDRFGRKFLFIFPCLGTLFRTIYETVGMHFEAPLYYNIIGYFIEGCTGQIFSIFQVAFMYASDITSPGKQRSFAIATVEFAFGMGATFPTIAMGYLLKQTNNFFIPMYISCGLLVISLILMITIPETYGKEVRNEREYIGFHDNLKDATDLYFSKENYGRRWMYIILLTTFALISFNIFGRIAVEEHYLLNSPFCFGPDELGIFNSLKTGSQQLVGMLLVSVILMCTSDEGVAIIGCLFMGISFVLEAQASSEVTLYIVSVVGCCGVLTIPMIRSIMSKLTPPEKQGAVFASISAAETMFNMISAVSSNSIYIATLPIYRGFIFLLYATINGVSIVLIMIFMFRSKSIIQNYMYIEV